MGSDDGDHHDHSIFSHDLTYDLNSKLMLTAIVSLSAVIILVVALHLYARCALRRRGRGRGVSFRGFPGVISRFAASKRGLDRSVIASLPTFVVGARTDGREGAAWTETECAVCLSGLEEKDTARVLPNCKHVFHVDCIDAWLESHATCPICRAEAEPRARLEPEPREGPVGVAPPSAPPLEEIRLGQTAEGAASSSSAAAGKVGGSVSRLDSFRRILTRERSSNRINPSRGDEEDRIQDLERQ